MSETKTSPQGEWSSHFAFVLAATGSAVGLGNIWKFPYITGENGGGAFVLVYLLCVALVGIPIMMAETLMGRRGRYNPITTLETLTTEAKADEHWHYLGWMGIAAGILILSYYSVIAGWASAYVLKAFTGSFFGADGAATKQIFADFIASPLQLTFWHSAFMLATMGIVKQGVCNGLEKYLRWLMPCLFALLIILLGYSMLSPSYFDGLHFLFNLDFSKLTGSSILTALGQAFFSLGIGMGAVMVYGAYLPKKVSISQTVVIVAAADTIVALLAGLIIFPIVFSNNLPANAGPGLIFETLPIAFGSMTGGWLFGILFFVMLVLAALSSSVALVEPAVSWLIETRGFTREKASLWAGGAAWLLGFASIFSFNSWSEFKLFGLTLFELIDYITSNLMLPIGGFAIAIFAGWMMVREHSEQELALPNQQQFQLWQLLIKYLAPAAVFFIFLDVVGVL